MSDATLQDRFEGCLLGGAIGDALGYPVEFSSYRSITSRFGDNGIEGYDLDGAGVALFSDDTQMTLFTAEGLVAAGAGAGEEAAVQSVYAAYLDWLRTQRCSHDGASGQSWLLEVPGLFARRAPGSTCLSALGSGTAGSREHPLNHSKGCGGVMRVAPMGLFFSVPDQAVRVAAQAAALTHGHPLGYISAACLAFIVNRCVWAAPAALGQAVRDCIDRLPGWFADEAADARKMGELLTLALDLARQPSTDQQDIARLGEGWVGEEALAIAVYAAVRHEGDFAATVVAAVNHDGDSDSTGAIAGNIAGAQLGAGALDAQWTDPLELRETIVHVADDLYACVKPTARAEA